MFTGSITALITPFLENGKIDETRFCHLVQWQIEQGTEGLVICGTTGESSTLSSEEQGFLVKLAVKEARGRIPILAGTGSNDTEVSIGRTKAAKEAGAAGCLVIFPYCNRPTFEGCLAHFEKISQCGLPMIPYYHPGRTGVKLSVKQLSEISRMKGMVGIKDSSGEIHFGQELIQGTPVPVLSGDDSMSLPLLACGAKGVISVLGNVIPKEWASFVKAAMDDEIKLARDLYSEMSSLCRAMTLETNPQCIKYAVSLIDKCLPVFRLPLLPPQEKVREAIQKALFSYQQREVPKEPAFIG